ncbi:MAG TPA: hypothetical protein PKD91_10140, partial [Bacteroidia bacterium]|nr:hypothetical protein [Bacteroidia bacterium]
MKIVQNCTTIIFGFLATFVFLFVTECHSQYAQEVIRKLSSPSFDGRGYYKQGDNKAAKFIREEFIKAGLADVSGSYFQPFQFPVNTFPGKMNVSMGNKKLIAGKDYIVSPACPSIKGTFSIFTLTWPLPDFTAKDYSNYFILVDKSSVDSTGAAAFDSLT